MQRAGFQNILHIKICILLHCSVSIFNFTNTLYISICYLVPGEMSDNFMANKRIRNKWWKAVTLSRNKGLVYERMAKQAYENVESRRFDQVTVSTFYIYLFSLMLFNIYASNDYKFWVLVS